MRGNSDPNSFQSNCLSSVLQILAHISGHDKERSWQGEGKLKTREIDVSHECVCVCVWWGEVGATDVCGNVTAQIVALALSLTQLDCLDGTLHLSGPQFFSLIKSGS